MVNIYSFIKCKPLVNCVRRQRILDVRHVRRVQREFEKMYPFREQTQPFLYPAINNNNKYADTDSNETSPIFVYFDEIYSKFNNHIDGLCDKS